jgi:ribokinase
MADVLRVDVAVFGSLHLDIMLKAPRLPVPDETVTGEDWQFKCGGKGGNQAVAAARAGASTAFVGCVGDDDFGKRLLANLKTAGVDCSRVAVSETGTSGMSVAIALPDGDYGAVIVSGTNRSIDARELGGIEAKVLLLQNEVPPEANLAAARLMAGSSARIVHNAAPFRDVGDELLSLTSLVVLNRVEAEAMTGCREPLEAARQAAGFGCDVIVTAGAKGCVVATARGDVTAIAAPRVAAGSSHGAGDVFCGTLAAALSGGDGLEAAARKAVDQAARHVAAS